MNSYLVTYELRNRGRDYGGFFDTLESFPEWSRPLESVWIVVSELRPSAVRERLMSALDPTDAILVVEAAKSNAWHGLPASLTGWMGQYM